MQRVFHLSILGVFLLLAPACDKESKESKDDKKEEAKNNKSDGDKAEKKAEAPSSDPDPSRRTRDWANEALVKVDDEVDGIKFSIEIPTNLARKAQASDGTFPGYVTWNGANPFMDPSFTVQIDTFPPTSLDAAARKVEIHASPAELGKKEEFPDGGMLVSFSETSKEFVNVRVWRKSASADKVVRITTQMRSTEAIENLDAVRGWMEKVATSFTVQ